MRDSERCDVRCRLLRDQQVTLRKARRDRVWAPERGEQIQNAHRECATELRRDVLYNVHAAVARLLNSVSDSTGQLERTASDIFPRRLVAQHNPVSAEDYVM